MNETHIRADIQRALSQFTDSELHENATQLLKVLGYESQRTLHRDANTPEAFLEDFNADNLINLEKALLHEWQTADFLFQLTADEIRHHTQETITFHEDRGVDNTIYYSYLFLAITLKGDTYSRTALANITREVNKLFTMPALVIFQHGHALTFAIINRRPSQRDADRDVLEKVTLIKDIDVITPHRAHIDILAELSLDALYQQHGFRNFLELHQGWQKTLDTSELNRRFFKEIADWYFWAVDKVTFPYPLDKGRGMPSGIHTVDFKGGSDGSVGTVSNRAIHNATCVIRLITRLIFVWFLKEKDLVPNALFEETDIAALLTNLDPDESTYYKAILQNLFFATLNQEINPPPYQDVTPLPPLSGGKPMQTPLSEGKPTETALSRLSSGKLRKFRGDGRQHYNITSLYRYKRYFKDPDAALRLFETIPFLNGGLFECLDKPTPVPVGASSNSRPSSSVGGIPSESRPTPQNILRLDGFSDRADNPLSVPNELFFSEPQSVNLNAVYDTKNTRYTVRA